MRYSKFKIALTAILVTSSFIFIIFLIFKGIDYSKKISSIDPESEEKKVVKTEEKTKVKTSVSDTKTTEKKTSTKKSTKKEEKKEVKTTKKTEPVKKTETKKEEKTVVKEEKVEQPVNKGLIGKYKLTQLILDGKDLTDKEIKQLRDEGNPLSLELKEKNVAIIQVLDTNGIYEYDNNYFYDGTNKISYSKNTDRVRIKIDNKNMLFVKE